MGAGQSKSSCTSKGNSKSSSKTNSNSNSNTKSKTNSEMKSSQEQRVNFSYKTADEWKEKTDKAWYKVPASWRTDIYRKYSKDKMALVIKQWILVQPRDKQEKLIKDLQYALRDLEENLFEDRAEFYAKMEKAYGVKL